VDNIKKFAHLYAKEKLSDDEAICARNIQCAPEIYNMRAKYTMCARNIQCARISVTHTYAHTTDSMLLNTNKTV